MLLLNMLAAVRKAASNIIYGIGSAVAVVALISFFVATTSSWAVSGCRQADALFARSFELSGAAVKSTLDQAVSLCPNHIQSLNNLALIEEQAGNYNQAEKIYYRMLAADPAALHGYAGLGDVHSAQARYHEAAEDYQLFLTYLQNEIKKGDPNQLAAHEPTYRKKLEQAMLKGRQAGVMNAKAITRGLTIPNKVRRLTRGIVLQGGYGQEVASAESAANAKVDLNILFKFNSDSIQPSSMDQINEIASSLLSAELADANILIEGHTDNVGSADYNSQLSLRRSIAIKDILISSGVPGNRLRVVGKGEAEPVMPNDTEQGRSLNRRVTLVNME